MRELEYVEGRNIVIEGRWYGERIDRLPTLADELVRLNVDVIVAGTAPAPEAAGHATSTIPIVMALHSDPVGSGLVVSLARPGRNVTGMSTLSLERAPGNFAGAFSAMRKERADGAIVITSSMFYAERIRIAKLAAENRVPAIYGAKEFAGAGGLMTYGIDIHENFRRAAGYVDKILKGAKPGDLPIGSASRSRPRCWRGRIR